ncbi:MAG: 6-bladed beta-propeller [bacterium]
MAYHSSSVVATVLVFLIFSLSGCKKSKTKTTAAPPPPASLDLIKGAKSFADFTVLEKEVQLSSGKDHFISLITDFDIDQQGNIIICDGWQSKTVFIADTTGKFLSDLGGQGHGPGEYQTPLSVAINREGEIFLNDYMGRKVLVYTSNYNYKSMMFPDRTEYFIHINKNDEIFLYDGMLQPSFIRSKKPNIFPTIHKFSSTGKHMISFALIPEEISDLNFSAGYNGMVIDTSGFIYEINPLFYRIRKYDSEGKLIKEFSEGKIIYEESEGRRSPVLMQGPLVLDKGIVFIQYDNQLDFYDTDGNLLVKSIPFEKDVLGCHGNSIYVKLEDYPEANPKIGRYTLR